MKTVALAVVILGLAASPAMAADVYLVAKEYTKDLPAEDMTPVVDFGTVAGGIQSYGGGQDAGGTATVEDGGATLHIVGNAWKKIAFPYAFTSATILELDFKSTAQAEIHGIGFDNDDAINVAQTYQFWGTQTPWGIQDFNNYPSGADVDGWQHYVIPVGLMFAGNPGFMTFTNDDDNAPQDGESYFRNVKVHEPGSATVTMWGFAEDLTGGDCYNNGPLDPACVAAVPSSPGPRITVDPTDSDLRIFLTNLLADPVSIVIPGQEMPWSGASGPTWDNGDVGARNNLTQRVRSFGLEAPPNGNQMYSWDMTNTTAFRAGTFIYQSGTNPAVQVQMGLYGAVTQDAAVGEAYPGAAYANEVELFYSEIDPALHAAVAGGIYGTPAYPSTLRYDPKYFLTNGEPYDPDAPGSQTIGGVRTDETLLIRFFNAGLRTHVPTLNDPYMSVVAEDGNAYPFARSQYSVRLAAGKTMDALLTPTASGSYAIYDHMLDLANAGRSPGGLISFLTVLVPGVLDFNAHPILSYGGSQDPGTATVSIEDGGATLHIVGNGWKAIALPYVVTPGVTTIEFDFKSTAEGDIHGLGFDTDLATIDPTQTFEFYGTQAWGIQTYNDYPLGADVNGWTHYSITVPAGYPLGNALYLTFANDDDVGANTGESYFRNVIIGN